MNISITLIANGSIILSPGMVNTLGGMQLMLISDTAIFFGKRTNLGAKGAEYMEDTHDGSIVGWSIVWRLLSCLWR